MRTTFLIDLDCRPVSANAPKAQPHAFKVADVLWLVEAFTLAYGDIPAGTKLFVSYVSEDDGTMWLLAEGDVPALFHWDNMIVISPYDCEDFLPCLRAVPRMHSEAIPTAPGIARPSLERRLGVTLKLVACAVALSWAVVPHVIPNHHVHHVTKSRTAYGTTQLATG